MYIDKIVVKNYRNYKETEICLKDDINVIVGSNNSGKTNILNIISILKADVKLNIDDFNKNELYNNFTNYLNEPPVISIEYYMKHKMSSESNDSGFTRLKNFILYDSDGNLNNIGTNEYLINAKIVCKYELNPKYIANYISTMVTVQNYDEFIHVLKKFEEYYEVNYYGSSINEIVEKKNVKQLFNINSVDANRNINEITINTKKYVKNKILEKKIEVETLKDNINNSIKKKLKSITMSINDDINKDQNDIGVSNGKNDFISTFEFDSDFTEFFKYELQNGTLNYTLPLYNNGLGYNNLIYIRNALNFNTENEFNLLLLEEPEAHLHPNMQYKLITFIEKYIKRSNNFYQVFITTHSSNIAASTKIDNVILLDYKCDSTSQNVKCINLINNFNSDYISRNYNVNIEQEELNKNKKHLEKFLDVTRSDLLFADKVILVEGISEKILIPHIYKNEYKEDLVNKFISVIEVGGVTFKNFLPLFLGTSKKVLCISDVDYKIREIDDFNEINFNIYREEKLKSMGREIYLGCDNYNFITQLNGGSTFEKELFFANNKVNQRVLLQHAFTNDKVKNIINNYSSKCFKYVFWKDNAEQIIDDERIWNSINELSKKFEVFYIQSTKDVKKIIDRHFICELFYKYVKTKKGDFALEISFEKGIKFPKYILEGLKWIIE